MDYARQRDIADQIHELFPHEVRAVEISGDEIVMLMSPANRHKWIAWLIQDQLRDQLRDTDDPRLIAHCGVEIENPELGVKRRPDVTILPFESLDDDRDAVDPGVVEMVFEVVSRSNHGNDYTNKMQEYPAMGIPVYVIVDPRKGVGAVFSDVHSSARGPRYATRTDFDFGDTVRVGAWTVDTSGFHTY